MSSFACDLLILLLSAAGPCDSTSPTALDHYVRSPDSAYRWEHLGTYEAPGFMVCRVRLTSQVWPKPTNRTQWEHHVQVLVPDKVKTRIALLVIAGGATESTPPEGVDGTMAQIAMDLGCILVHLFNVPNQPLQFADEPFEHREDQIVAYTFGKYLDTGDSGWICYLPMVNAVIRAMDMTQAFVPSVTHDAQQVDGFIVTGASKRGWTAWLAAAVDPKARIRAVAPLVADMLNLKRQARHQREYYADVIEQTTDGVAIAIGQYTYYDLLNRLDTSRGKSLLRIVDPYSYIRRKSLTVPKYIVNAAGDEFYPPDSSHFYISDLAGPTFLRYVPNKGHGIDTDEDTLRGAISFGHAIIADKPLPKYTWTITRSGRTIEVRATDKPVEVRMWHAANPESRDFRMSTFGAHWKPSPLKDTGGGTYVASVERPTRGFLAFFVELRYTLGDREVKFTTPVSIAQAIQWPDFWTLFTAGELLAIALGLVVYTAWVRRRRCTHAKSGSHPPQPPGAITPSNPVESEQSG